MSNRAERDDLLYEIASAYYLQKQLQRQIAERYGISRVQISKYLKTAEKLGIVRIEVMSPRISKTKEEDLGKRLRKHFPLESLLLAARSIANPERLYRLLAKRLYQHLSELPNQEMNIGVGWGQTIHEISEFKFEDELHKSQWTIVPLSGGLSSISDKNFNINRIASKIADSLDAQPKLLYLPFFLENDYRRKLIVRDESHAVINKIWDNLDLIICSVGHLIDRSPFCRQAKNPGHFLNKLLRANVVGDFMTHYYDIRGKVFDFSFVNSLVNIKSEQFRSARQRIIVAGGVHKVESLIGMLRTGLVDVLISDEKTIANILDYVTEGPGA